MIKTRRKTRVFFKSVLTFSLALALVLPGMAFAAEEPGSKLNDEDRAYLDSVYRATWNYLARIEEKSTGLPYDASSLQPPTSITNIGLYLAVISTAYRTGLISSDEASGRVSRCLSSLQQIETWRGFPRPWIVIRTLKPTFGDEFTYGPHLSSLLGGLLVAQSTFPEIAFPDIAPRIEEMIGQMEFKSLYDARSGWLKGGYNVKTNNFAIYQAWGHWYYKYLASEIRLLSFYMVARGVVPTEHWFKLKRLTHQREGETFLISGYEDGGMYVPYLTGLFLDEREMEMGASQISYARSQMKHAATVGSPVWGWSASLTPQGRYLGYGELRDDIVAPYASMLAAMYFPEEAAENLRKLEELGARPQQHSRFGEGDFGFRDAINWKTGDTARHYLTPNQAMGFLALANTLYDGVVWKSFREAPVVEKRIEVLRTELEVAV